MTLSHSAAAALHAGEAYPSQSDIAAEQLVETAIAALTANDERLGMIEVDLRATTLNATVEKEQRIEYRTDNLEFTGWLRPRTIHHSKIVMHGERLHVSVLHQNKSTATWIRNDEQWSFYAPDSDRVWIRHAQDLPGMPSLDPREMTVTQKNRRLVDILAEDAVLSAQLTATNIELGADHPARKRRLARIETQDRHGNVKIFVLDPTVGFLPILSVFPHDAGRDQDAIVLGEVVLNQYQLIPQREAWFLKKSVRKLYGPRARARTFDAPGWNVRTEQEITSIRLLNPSERPGQFALRLPDGTEVRDAITHRRYTVGQHASGSGYSLGVWAVAALALAIAVTLVMAVRNQGRIESPFRIFARIER